MPAMHKLWVLFVRMLCFVMILFPLVVSAQECPRPGDVNDDGQITPRDAQRAFQHFLSPTVLQGCPLVHANVFRPGDSVVTPADVLCILQRFLGLPSCFDAPLASAGGNQYLARSHTTGAFPPVLLDGSASRDPQGLPLTYHWHFLHVPPTSPLEDTALTAPTAVATSFLPDVVGTYTLALTVTTEQGEQAQDVVFIVAQSPEADPPPECQCADPPGEIVPLALRVTDAAGNPLADVPVMFTLSEGDGTFLPAGEQPTMATLSPTNGQMGQAACTPADLPGPPPAAIRCTGPDGVARALLVLGQAPRHTVTIAVDGAPETVLTIRVRQLSSLVFADANLQVCVEETATAQGWTTAEEVTFLDCNSRDDIAKLEGIQQLENLRLLSLDTNQVVDVTPLANLTALEILFLGFNRVVDVTPLAGLTALRDLRLNGNQVVDVTPLASLTNLTFLFMDGNPVGDVTPLASLTALTGLFLGSAQVVDVAPLASLTALTDLRLGGNQIVDVTPLANLTALTTLFLSRNQVVDVTPLATLTALTDLSLDFNQLVDVAPLATLTALMELRLDFNRQLTEVLPLQTLTSLSVLSLTDDTLIPCVDLDTLENVLGTGVIERPATCI